MAVPPRRAHVPVLVLREGTGRATGRDAQRNNIMAAKTVAKILRSTLGPCGMDKMIATSYGDLTITNDGATILKSLNIQHPAARLLIEVANTLDAEVGDGTTTAVVLAGELLARAEELLDQKVHPNTIIEGYTKAGEKALEILEKVAVPISKENDELLINVALTSLRSKGVTAAKQHFARLAVEAVKYVAEETDDKIKADIGFVKILKKHGKSLNETELVKGFVIDKPPSYQSMPRRIENARIALLTAKLEVRRTKFDSRVEMGSPEQLKLFIDEEEHMMKEMAEKISKTGANVVFCQKPIDELALHFLAMKNILAVKSVPMLDMERLARATGGKIIASLDDLTPNALGEAKTVEEVKIGEDKAVCVRECKDPRSVTIIVRGGSQHIVDEAERSLHDALSVVRNAVEEGKIVAGGGATEIELSRQLKRYAASVGGREQLAIEAYAEATEVIPMALAENAGLDPIDVLVSLKAKHEADGNPYCGIDILTREIKNMFDLSVIEPLRVKKQIIKSAIEAANMILKVDDLIAIKEEKEKKTEEESSP